MSNISKRRREGSRAKIKSMGDHKEFLKRITKTLYYGQLPSLPNLSLPVTEESCALWSAAQQGRSLRRLHADAAARLARGACVSPCALVLALLYLERLRARNPEYLTATAPAQLFLVSLMVGNKFLQDDGEDDEVLCSEWAAAGDLPPADLKNMEIEFLSAIDWNVFVNEESFEAGLSRLERRVALRQGGARGFFTYGDLAAAGARADGLAHAGLACAALALAYVAALGALVAGALLVAAALPLLARAPAPPSTPAAAPAVPAPNGTTELPAFDLKFDMRPEQPRCCTEWLRYRESSEPRKNRSESGVASEWKWFEGRWGRAALRLRRRSRVDPVRRWLDIVDEYAERAAPRRPAPREPGCEARARLDVAALAAAVSDR